MSIYPETDDSSSSGLVLLPAAPSNLLKTLCLCGILRMMLRRTDEVDAGGIHTKADLEREKSWIIHLELFWYYLLLCE